MAFSDHMDNIFEELDDLSELQRHTLKERYRFLLEEYRRRCRIYAILFYMFRLTVTVGSLAVPALLSIQNGNTTLPYLYWLTWGISLAVTTSNGIMTLFKVDKRFFMLHATAERLRSETWQFIQLSGRYSGHHGTHHHHKATHANQYVYYCSQLEKINMKRVDDEYIKTTDEIHGHVETKPATTTGPQKPSGDLMVPSPADQSGLKTPNLSERDSISLIGDDDEEEKPEKPERPEKPEKPEKPEQQKKSEKQRKPERPERQERPSAKNPQVALSIPQQSNVTEKPEKQETDNAVIITMSVSDTQTTTLSPVSTGRQSVLSEPSAL